MKNTKVVLILLISLIIILTSCNPDNRAPTADPMAIYTQAAETVAAQLTSTALASPATETPAPTPTAPPTEVPPTQTPVIATSAPAVVPTLPAIAPTATQAAAAPTTIVQQSGDAARWDSQSPVDGTVMEGNKGFQFMVSMLNTGSTTWSNSYSMAYLSGVQLGAAIFPCSRESTKPGEKCDFYLAATTPIDKGKYTSRYWMINPQGAKIPGGEIYFNFEVK